MSIMKRALGAWQLFARALAALNARVLLSLLFVLLLTPIGLIRRASGKSALRSADGGSHWKPRPTEDEASSMERQF